MKKIQLWVVLPIIFLSLGLAVSKLGVLDDVGIEVQEQEGFRLVGKEFNGTVDDKKLGKIMEEVYGLSEQTQLQYVVYYQGNPDQSDEAINIFIGLKTSENLEGDFKELVLKPYKAVRTEIENSFFAPNPANVNKAIKEYAAQHQLKLEDTYIEFYDDNKVITEIVCAE
ncbi:GyrI-like domain-containing protein [Sediminitomix flava]|uniref:GyrI-like small molecule binding protein n=1 Tax=Sediminitomix flava TaxID=379075 RepID=A0A315Z6I3_SEDFL|nr:GyrI-like domain-containing protein [Sediminitomix flava]PWJ39322.1 hypothetical protein BC781_106223 [Sediminitomix flava]